MNKKVKATICIVIVMWMVAFVQIGVTKLLYGNQAISLAFARNQLATERITTELKVNLGTKDVNAEGWKKTFGEEIKISVLKEGKDRYLHAKLDGDRREEMKNCLLEAGISRYELSVCTESSYAGRMTDEKKEDITNQILKQCGAMKVNEIAEENWYSVYGYTAGEEDSIYAGGRKANLNIAIFYDETAGVTRVYVGSPIISKEF